MRSTVLVLSALAACSQVPEITNQTSVAVNSNATTTVEPPADGPVFDSIGELTRSDEVQVQLRGGRVADPKNWQASFYTQSAGGSCTASIVGDRVLLTAAHCVANGATVTLRRGGTPYRAVCEHAPEYVGGGRDAATADYALCAIEKSVPGVPAERVNANAASLTLGTQVLLTGFGCTTDQGTGGNDGVYRIGEATIVSLPSGNNNDITASGGAALCFGDSSGPAFINGSGSGRLQISVNSRVENRDPTGVNLGLRSFLSSLTTPQSVKFLKDWSSRNKLMICGVDPQATTCRP
jgi:hypothetical protein